MSATRSERLTAAGAEPGDWGLFLPVGYTYAGNGLTRGNVHLAIAETFPTAALCGTWIVATHEQASQSLLDKSLCPKCLRAFERREVTT